MRILARWRPRHLLAAWSAYWLGLAAVTLTPIVIAISRLTSGAAPGQSNVTVNFGSAGLSVIGTRAGATVLQRSASLLELGLWIAGPPLLLWGAWLYEETRGGAASARALDDAEGRGELPEGDAMLRPPPRSRETEPRRRRLDG